MPPPFDKLFALLPEQIVETITAFLLTAMKSNQHLLMVHYSPLDSMVTFCIVGLASPLHIKNLYLHSKLIEVILLIFVGNSAALVDEKDDEEAEQIRRSVLFRTGSHVYKFTKRTELLSNSLHIIYSEYIYPTKHKGRLQDSMNVNAAESLLELACPASMTVAMFVDLNEYIYRCDTLASLGCHL